MRAQEHRVESRKRLAARLRGLGEHRLPELLAEITPGALDAVLAELVRDEVAERRAHVAVEIVDRPALGPDRVDARERILDAPLADRCDRPLARRRHPVGPARRHGSSTGSRAPSGASQ